MDVWGWNSPIAWALFLMGCGATVVLLALAVRLFSSIPMPTSLTQNKKR